MNTLIARHRYATRIPSQIHERARDVCSKDVVRRPRSSHRHYGSAHKLVFALAGALEREVFGFREARGGAR
jgi:hypothetical protein